jgi:hypothetical protein
MLHLSINHRIRPTILVAMTGLTVAACATATEPSAGPAVASLTRAGECTITPVGNQGFIGLGGKGAFMMTLGNDGGWCWDDTFGTQYGKVVPAYYARVTTAPQHGKVVIGEVSDRKIRIAYQPDAGFVGTDLLVVHVGEVEVDMEYRITVSR